MMSIMAQYHAIEAPGGWCVFDVRNLQIAALNDVRFARMSAGEAEQVAQLLSAIAKDQKFKDRRRRRWLKAHACGKLPAQRQTRWIADAALMRA